MSTFNDQNGSVGKYYSMPAATGRVQQQKRRACLFEVTRSWRININDVGKKLTAHWSGPLKGTLVVFVDNNVVNINSGTHDQPFDPYGKLRIDGHDIVISPSKSDWSAPPANDHGGGQSMELLIDGQPVMTKLDHTDYETVQAAREIARNTPGVTTFATVLGAPTRKRPKADQGNDHHDGGGDSDDDDDAHDITFLPPQPSGHGKTSP